MADDTNTQKTAAGQTGNAVIDGVFGLLRGVVGLGGEVLTTAATGIERIAAARVALLNKNSTPSQAVNVPTNNPNASDVAKVKLWATYAAISAGAILAGLLLYKKLK